MSHPGAPLAACLTEMKAGIHFQLSLGPFLYQVWRSSRNKGWKLALHPSLATPVVPLSWFTKSLMVLWLRCFFATCGQRNLLRLGTLCLRLPSWCLSHMSQVGTGLQKTQSPFLNSEEYLPFFTSPMFILKCCPSLPSPPPRTPNTISSLCLDFHKRQEEWWVFAFSSAKIP